MDARLSRSQIVRKKDPHDWNSYDHYRTIHEKRLAEHPFIDQGLQHTLEFQFVENEGDLFLLLQGQVFCCRNVVLEVEKVFETRVHRTGILQIRGLVYRYVAWVKNGNPILRYHNVHLRDEDYHHRIFDKDTGKEVFYERLSREQFPLFTDVLNEIELLTRPIGQDAEESEGTSESRRPDGST